MIQTQIPQGFRALGLSPSLLTKLDRLGFVTPTPIQDAAIPVALEGRDLIGIAQTGTGKTLAFGLPMVARAREGHFGLVLAPTRELATQIEETFIQLGVKTALLIGGAAMGPQIHQLRAKPMVVIATPGRLMDHMGQRNVNLHRVSVAVLDEADRMLDMGFAPAIRKILDVTPKERQTMLFSATMPSEIEELAQSYLRNPQNVSVASSGTVAELVSQELAIVTKEGKTALLGNLLSEHEGTVLVFSRTRHGARKLARSVRAFGHTAAEIHSDRTLPQRRAALQGFKTGQYRVLVATDIAARGIDVKDISLVVNYDVPEQAEDYVHRIGRTGRAGSQGRAITFATPEQSRDVRDIEKLMNAELPLSAMSPMAIERPKPAAPKQGAPKQQSGSWRPRSNNARPGGRRRFGR
jgi:ATP-dependent RNA helicase RhlE